MAEAKTALSALEELHALAEANAEQLARIQVDAARSGKDGYLLQLFEPIMLGEQKVQALRFRAQTLKDVRDSKNDDELTALLCGITVDQLKQLSGIDYASTQEVIAGFHLRRAASGPALKG